MIRNYTSKSGQAHTVEALSAAVMLLTAVVFAQAVTAVTPLTASTASQHTENQQGELIQGFLAFVNNDDTLKRSILYWDEANGEYHDANGATIFYTVTTPDTRFGDLLSNRFISDGLGVRIDMVYYRNDGSGGIERVQSPYVELGTASTHAYTASTLVTLYDDDNLIKENGTTSSTTLDSSSTFFMQDIDPDSDVYNVVEIQATIWRI